MQLIKGIIIRIIKHAESKKIIHLYSEEQGSMFFITAPHIFKDNNVGINVMQVVEIEYLESLRSEIKRIVKISPIVDIHKIYNNIYKVNIAVLWSEVLYNLIRKEPKNNALYDFIVHSIEYLAEIKAGIANFNLFFLYRLSVYIGYKINTDSYRENYVFNINGANFIDPNDKTYENHFLSGPNVAKAIHFLLTCKTEDLYRLMLDKPARLKLLDIVLAFYHVHFGQEFNIKSIKVIMEVFE
ncbi:MAG: DNA repair protein RecO C-terminal domain-containing protein [Culturomica sp.]|jgi:DNA repair protein RecO (recombination protein O)|nr:DNA repair protein RecO C-terminal domain-containing protein [Culturomica sp.]